MCSMSKFVEVFLMSLDDFWHSAWNKTQLLTEYNHFNATYFINLSKLGSELPQISAVTSLLFQNIFMILLCLPNYLCPSRSSLWKSLLPIPRSRFPPSLSAPLKAGPASVCISSMVTDPCGHVVKAASREKTFDRLSGQQCAVNPLLKVTWQVLCQVLMNNMGSENKHVWK